ncbi:cinnamoyl- reductase-like SNL6 isoform X2 [Olea europaea subsp. europaea]|uniref:Cinnamoyl- reductase-like SNL6 isoform X2 n=1 Tax=Olea europaea subsp. europaea TaxID=158383 RepID=A0A8S0TR71_OLEEU|nr:cinnamoyl- reductase-like SNL6 isoform X2 [Olea europaea subsp. europaea]
MGILRLHETENAEIDEFRRMLLSCAAGHRRKDGDDLRDRDPVGAGNGDVLEKLVCVTSGVSYLGIAVVKQLLVHGYSVRIIVDNEDVAKLGEMEISGEMRLTNSIIEIVMAKLTEIESLANAFDGCRGVFHTAGFIDPSGLSGYSKAMADIEVNASKNVVEACAITPSVRNCLLTSSLLTCIWRDNSRDGLPSLIDHSCWSDESFCLNRKLWCALGKLRAEKSAWEVAKESGVKLATICPGLITGPDFYRRSPTSTVAYLKGVQDMFADGLLATVDVNRLAEAHVCIFEGMKKTASGRYICFDRIIESGEEIENLARETGINTSTITGGASSSNRARYELSNQKLFRQMSRTWRCFNE